MATYQAIYKCRLCGETFASSVLSEAEVDKCFNSFWKGRYRYNSMSGRSDIPKECSHFCKDGSIGFAAFQGFRKVE